MTLIQKETKTKILNSILISNFLRIIFGNFESIAHRGFNDPALKKQHARNSEKSYTSAIEHDPDYLEADLRCFKEGVDSIDGICDVHVTHDAFFVKGCAIRTLRRSQDMIKIFFQNAGATRNAPKNLKTPDAP